MNTFFSWLASRPSSFSVRHNVAGSHGVVPRRLFHSVPALPQLADETPATSGALSSSVTRQPRLKSSSAVETPTTPPPTTATCSDLAARRIAHQSAFAFSLNHADRTTVHHRNAGTNGANTK